jgi:GntR family transcriptional regulator
MLTVRLDDPLPIHDQIMAGLRRLIAAATVRPGDELPPVRQLAADLGVNLNTVARAYRALETDGLVSSVRGRGTVVLADREAPGRAGGTRKAKEKRIASAIGDALADAKLAGLSRHDALRITTVLLDLYWPAESPRPK